MKTIRDSVSLREQVQSWRQDGESVALVPTMGGLHQGHVSLVRLAAEHADRIVASVFVNPTQFGAGEDFDAYPRTLDLDRRRLSRAGADVLFAPTAEEIYPHGIAEMTSVVVPGLSTILCGADRPGHFDGVTNVVCRLLNIVLPDVAVFGKKDYQQLVIIQKMVADLHLPVRLIGGPTQRAKDGLALSSRNRYLNDDERPIAPLLYQQLRQCRDAYLAGDGDIERVESIARTELKAAGFVPDYVAIRTTENLKVPASQSDKLVVLAAARLGRTRLIDNLVFDDPDS